MKRQDPHPHLPDQLRDPKLPVIHSGSGMQQRRTEAPLPQPENRADPL